MSVVCLDIHVLAANGNITTDVYVCVCMCMNERTNSLILLCHVQRRSMAIFHRQAWVNILRDPSRRFIRVVTSQMIP